MSKLKFLGVSLIVVIIFMVATVWYCLHGISPDLPQGLQNTLKSATYFVTNMVYAASDAFQRNLIDKKETDEVDEIDDTLSSYFQLTENNGKDIPSLESTPTNTLARVPSVTLPAARDERRATKKGVSTQVPEAADWAVTRHVTYVYGEDGKTIGTVHGGRFFLITGTTKIHNDVFLIGNFTPKALPKTAYIMADDTLGLTGSPDKLSERQRVCLREYFQLSGEAENIKARIMAKSAAMSPYAQKAAERLRELRKAIKMTNAPPHATDANRKATYDISQLQLEVNTLNEKHRNWKEQNQDKLPTPENDPRFKEIKSLMRIYSRYIGDLLE